MALCRRGRRLVVFWEGTEKKRQLQSLRRRSPGRSRYHGCDTQVFSGEGSPHFSPTSAAPPESKTPLHGLISARKPRRRHHFATTEQGRVQGGRSRAATVAALSPGVYRRFFDPGVGSPQAGAFALCHVWSDCFCRCPRVFERLNLAVRGAGATQILGDRRV
jgi:hypothetical protein